MMGLVCHESRANHHLPGKPVGPIGRRGQHPGQRGVNIRALSLADSADFGILRLIVHDTEKASQVLKAEGFTVAKTEVGRSGS